VRFGIWRLCLLALIFSPFCVAVRSAEPPRDRPFTVAWEMAGIHQDFREDFRGAYFLNTDNGWVVGTHGTIVALHDGGASWESQESGTNKYLAAVYFIDIDARTGWAVGEAGTIRATRDGGVHWNPQQSGTQDDLRYVIFADAHTGWVVGANGTALATHDAGESWQSISERQAGLTYNLANSETGWVVLQRRTISVTYLNNAYSFGVGSAWGVGRNGAIFVTSDAGAHWSTQASGTDQDLTGVYFVNTQIGWVVGKRGTVLATVDGGQTWRVQNAGTTDNLSAVHFADARTGWVVGENGTILSTRDGGVSWETPTKPSLWSVYFVDARTGWVVGA